MSKMTPLTEWIASPKTAATVAGTTTTVGFGEVFQWIPSDIGRVAALAGFVLSCVLIYVNILAAKKTSIEIKRLLESHKERDDHEDT